VPFEATLEKSDNVSVIRVLSKGEASAVVHELFEFVRLVAAKLFNTDLLLLFLDVGVFLLLRSTRKPLPWECPFEEVEEYMTNGLKIISS